MDKRTAAGRPPRQRRDSVGTGYNAEYIAMMYEQWKEDPAEVPETWRLFFEGFELGIERGELPGRGPSGAHLQAQVDSLMYAYRSEGHRIARTNPLGDNLDSHPDLDLETFELTEDDLEAVFDTGHLYGPPRASLREIIAICRDTYCRSVGVEYVHIQDLRTRRWLQEQMEPIRNRPSFAREVKRQIFQTLIDAEMLEQFIHSRYPGQKRFSIEGGESAIVALRAIIELSPQLGVDEVVLGMAHRGRLNVLANILGMSTQQIFTEFEGNFLPDTVGGDGDVKYHKGYSSNYVSRGGKSIHLSLTANPSHLEAVCPVVQGRVRAKQRRLQDTQERTRVVPLLIHGEAAFSGQGLVAETLNLSKLDGYRTGGTIHILVNNQIAFTTLPGDSRSTTYSTDVMKMIQSPIFHVNGEDPEAVVHVVELALRYRQRYNSDVIVDMLCYRKHGHNESDEPRFTQPVMYKAIQSRPSVRELYEASLKRDGVLSQSEIDAMIESTRARLQGDFDAVKQNRPVLEVHAFGDRWAGLDNPFSHAPTETAVSESLLHSVARGLNTVPNHLNLNPKVARQLPGRLAAVEESGVVDWAYAEALAIGTLLCEGTPVRLSGQDCRRGTFSQRHAMWSDMETQEPYIPANHLAAGQARFCVYNSPLSEASVLGFEYGYSLDEPYMLIMWEAQFGDFANGAQVIIDQFLFSSRSKWQRSTGLVMLLPHGYEGQGPEHSNAYLERYLMGCAEDNIQVCNLSTPAQYFHALRRQTKRNFRLPLVIMAPKSMLRHKMCVSPVSELIEGRFHEFLDDPTVTHPESIRRLVLCSGKYYYDLLQRRDEIGANEVAIVRVEQFYPFHRERFAELVERYAEVTDIIWTQEESANRGGWTYMFPILHEAFSGRRIQYVGRARSASPSTGSLRKHQEEQTAIVVQAIGR
ncbi:MAG: 2-oxoglutarate dehydrogenase E1 component [Myxococcales bacterium]|nr:2-oxoglutarate dehydrogenase E1 component [Myxococcales bacterium]